jgi:hypothetical protein
VIRNEDNTLGIIVVEAEAPNLSQIRSAKSFLANNSSAKIIFLGRRLATPKVLDDRSLFCSIAAVL